jgi:hypothetical protein
MHGYILVCYEGEAYSSTRNAGIGFAEFQKAIKP